MSLERPEPTELVLSFDVGATIIEKTMLVFQFKCAMQNRENIFILFNENHMLEIIDHLPETIFMQNASKIEAEDAENGNTRRIDMMKKTAEIFDRFKPTLNRTEADKPPVKNVVTFYHLHIWPHYVGLALTLYSGRKKNLVMPIIVAARFKAFAESAEDLSRKEMVKRGYTGRI